MINRFPNTILSSYHHSISNILRVATASFLIWYLSGKSDQPRFKCSVLLGISVGFVTYAELSPLLLGTAVSSSSSPEAAHSNEPFALVALQVLTVTSFLVGMASGSLLPRFSVGMCFGGVLVLLGVALCEWSGLNHSLGFDCPGVFPLVGAGLAMIMGWISSR